MSIAFGTVTTVHDVETVINSYLSNTINEHALHATSYDYMRIVQDESPFTRRYLQSTRYILHGFPITNTTNDNVTGYKKLNFIQSIAYFYCGINMSYVMSTSLDSILINGSQLYMNSAIFPVQLVESYELVRSEICQRIKIGLYQSVVDMFKPNANADSFFSRFIANIANFISFNTRELFSLQSIGQMYPFLAKFGEFELYKKTVIDRILEINNVLAFLALESKGVGGKMSDIDTCVSQIKYPKVKKYVTRVLNSTGTKSFIFHDHNTSGFLHYVRMYQLLTGSAAVNYQVENNTVAVEMYNLLQLIDECLLASASFLGSATMSDCTLITFRIYESYKHLNGHEHVVNTIKCIISHHNLYCSKYGADYDHFSEMFLMLREDLIGLQNEAAFYPYLNELMNDTQFVNIVNNNTDAEIDKYLQTIFPKLMMLALEEYKDIEMIQKIAAVFKPKINVCIKCTLKDKYTCTWKEKSWMGVLIKHEYMYLTKYFQQRFRDQVDHCSQVLL